MNADKQFLTVFHTVRHLKAVQICNRLYRARTRSFANPVVARRLAAGSWTPAIQRDPARTGAWRFRFLNQEREPRGWNDADIPKLWVYNLHYFDHADPELMQRWVRENPVGVGNGWEAYPLSRRIVNWIKWELSGKSLDQVCLSSLATQAEWLSNSLEYHLLANHLFANAKALVFAGLFFSGNKPERWLRKGLAILREQLAEQVLSDGGHFERSPMYHSLILEDVLDLVNSAHVYRLNSITADLRAWKQAAGLMLSWLGKMCHPDGRISFFNDAAFGIAPEPASLFEYAGHLGIRPYISELGESGYVRLENRNTIVLFDAAPIGPDYQPGHSHADALSFEVSHLGHRLVVNSGTSTYECGPERSRQRGTDAHNTAVIDDTDQSEVWAAFRVARRAKPFDVRTDHSSYVEASHDGYHRMKSPVTHRRRVELTVGGLRITDILEGSGVHDVRIHFHIHPDAQVEIRMDQKLDHCLSEQSRWHPEFNVSIPNRRITGHYHGPIPVTFRTLLVLP